MSLLFPRLKNLLLSLVVTFILLFALKIKFKKYKLIAPSQTITKSEFKKKVKNGDLIGTLATNNIFSRLHSILLKTPIAHVGIAVVETEGDENGQVFLFESGLPRGAQLRNLDDYMADGADRLWWCPLNTKKEKRIRVVEEIEKLSSAAYSFSFIKGIPFELFGVEAPGISIAEKEHAFSCADMIARIYYKAGIMEKRAIEKNNFWLPIHYFLKHSQFGNNEQIGNPINVNYF
jgi:hypothetical protein